MARAKLTRLQDIKATKHYNKYKNIIHKFAWSASYFEDFDEMNARLTLAYVECLKTYDKNKSCFSTYLYRVLKGEIYKIKKEKEKMLYCEYDLNKHQETQETTPYFLIDLQRKLSEKAIFIIQKIFEAPEEFLLSRKERIGRGAGHHFQISNVRNYMHQIGFTKNKANVTIKEIKHALSII